MKLIAKALALYPKAAPYVDALTLHGEAHGINTVGRVAAFVAQLAHESGSFRYSRELWGPTSAQMRYEPPSPLATRLGNTGVGDGRRFMGRGLIQVTGRSNYAKASMAMFGDDRLLREPELLEKPDGAARSAVWFWTSRNLNQLADAGDFNAITRKINGGFNGLDDRLAQWAKCKEALI